MSVKPEVECEVWSGKCVGCGARVSSVECEA